MKICGNCKTSKPITDFRIASNGKIKRIASYCKPCEVEKTKVWRKKKRAELPIVQLKDLDGEVWRDFEIDGYGSDYAISSVARGERNHCGNFKWEYV